MKKGSVLWKEDYEKSILSKPNVLPQYEDPNSFQNSCTGLHGFDSPESSENISVSLTSTLNEVDLKCYINNNKRKPQLSFYNFRNAKGPEAR